MNKKTALALMIIFLSSGWLSAQTGQTGTINGMVRTPENEPLPGVSVILSSPALVIPSLETVTNQSGLYRFVSLPPGVYEVRYVLEGLEQVIQRGVQVHIGKSVTLDVNMTLQATSEAIVVEGQAPTIDRQKTVGITTLNREFLQSVPAQRELSDYYNMAPGVTGNTVFGSSTRENSYNLDGVNVGDPVTGTEALEFGMDIMEEISIQSGGLSAEYGSVKGAVINVVTKSGGNTLNGMLSFYFNHEKLQSDNTEGTGVEGTSGKQYQYEPSLSLGGPILKDRLWFFGNASFRQSNEYENGYPADDPDNPIPINEFQPYPYVKLTYSPNQANRFVLSYNFSDRRLDHRFAYWDQSESATAIQTSPTHVFNLSWNRQFGANFYTDFKAALVWNTLVFEAKDPNQAYQLDVETGIWSGSYFRAKDENIRDRYQFNANGTAFVDDFIGSHEFKFGAELQLARTQWNIDFSKDPLTGFSYMINFPEFYGNYGIYNYGYEIFDFARKENFNNIGLYFTDSWSALPNLTLNLGLRFESNATIWPAQMEDEGPQEFMGIEFNRSITESFTAMKWSNLAPRLGLVYDLFGDGTTLFKTSFGRYIQPNIIAWVNLGHPNGWFYYQQRYDWDYNLVGGPYNAQIPGAQAIGYPGYNGGELKAPYMDEVTVALERELFRDWSVGLRYVRKWDKNLIEDVDASQLDIDALLDRGELIWTNWEPVTAVDPFDGRELTFYNKIDESLPRDIYTINPPGAERNYSGLEFNLKKRFSDGWQIHLSYIYQKSSGLIPTTDENDGNGIMGTSGLYDDPNNHTNALGRFPQDRRHMLKFQGMIRGPWGINLSAYARVMSGRRYTRQVSSGDLGLNLHDDVVIYAETLGSHSYDPLKLVDLRAEKEFRFGRFGLRAFCDVFNVFNDSTVTVVRVESNRTSFDFGDAVGLISPRIFQLGAKIQF